MLIKIRNISIILMNDSCGVGSKLQYSGRLGKQAGGAGSRQAGRYLGTLPVVFDGNPAATRRQPGGRPDQNRELARVPLRNNTEQST